MKIAIDVSPLQTGHKVRGTGFYVNHLKESLLKGFPENSYTFFTNSKELPSVDIIHYPYFEPFFLSLPFRKKTKTIVTVHDLTPIVFRENFPVGVKGRVKWELNKRLLKSVDMIITDSNVSKNDIARLTDLSEEKISVIYLAASEKFKQLQITETQKKQIQKKYDLPEQFVLYVGDVTWNKNLPRLIEAVSKINVPLVMVGKALVQEQFDTIHPWNKDLVIVQQRVKKLNNIKRLGFVTTEELTMLYNLATLFVMPSIYEGFGLPILEAMQCGCPVIASETGSLPEVAGDAAMYVDPYQVNDIAEKIKYIFFSKEQQNKLSENGLEQARKFSWEKTVEETMYVYTQVLQKV